MERGTDKYEGTYAERLSQLMADIVRRGAESLLLRSKRPRRQKTSPIPNFFNSSGLPMKKEDYTTEF